MTDRADSLNQRAAAMSLGLNAILTALKFLTAVLTGSVSLLSEAFHSGTDVAASLVAYVSIRAASAPPDDDHPFGHGKIENLAGFGEGMLLLGVVAFIVIQAIANLIRGNHPEKLDLGLIAMSVSAGCAFVLGRYLLSVAKKTDSVALKSNGRHMMLDFWTSIGVLVALGIQKVTGFQQADSILAICLGLWLGFNAWKLVCEAFDQLIDHRVPDEEVAVIDRILCSDPDLISYHRLRTRHSGNEHLIDLHAVVPNDWSVVRAHSLADHLERQIAEALPPAQVVIHIDPFDPTKASHTK
jgi:cation diffusion facilitator family transporter